MKALIPVKTLVIVLVLTILGAAAFELLEDRRPFTQCMVL